VRESGAICFESHLYYPLLYYPEGTVPLKMRPLAFDAESEVQFVRDLEAFYKSPLGRDIIGPKLGLYNASLLKCCENFQELYCKSS
jgi:hypothetical protein